MDEFAKLINELLGEKPKAQPTKSASTLEELLKTIEKKEQEVKTEADHIRSQLAEAKERERREAKKAGEIQEIVVQYIPNEVGSCKVVKGGEIIDLNKPFQVAALIEAAARLMGDNYGYDVMSLSAELLNTLSKTIEWQEIMKELVELCKK